MSIAPANPILLTLDRHGELPPPSWVMEACGLRHDGAEQSAGGFGIRVARADSFTLVTARIRDASTLAARDLQRQVAAAYAAIHERLSSTGAPHAVRMWNHIPAINDVMPDGRDRYMVFNAGRFDAFCGWFGGPEQFGRQIPTATGVGHPGTDLVVHCLGARDAGVAVANPRQVQPFHYSRRFGPLPPCFARATVVRRPTPLLLVGGTASIRGEDSLHALDFAGQMGETLANLAAMVHAATGHATPPSAGDLAALKQYRDLRVYLPDGNRAAAVQPMIAGHFPQLRKVEFLQADLCRPELLVEIEGLAELGDV